MRSLASTAFAMLVVLSAGGFRISPRMAPTDACSLLTSPEIDKAMGVPMGAGKALASAACQWRQSVKAGDAGAIVDVTILDTRRYDIGKAIASSPKFKVTPVSGLGDESYYSASTDGKLTVLRVKKGDAAFAVRVWGGGVPAEQAEPKELALAKVIVTKF